MGLSPRCPGPLKCVFSAPARAQAERGSMQCARCGVENPEGKKFCQQCGSSLTHRCPSCESENLPGAKFCGDCGMVLGATEKPPALEGRKGRGTSLTRKAKRPVVSP